MMGNIRGSIIGEQICPPLGAIETGSNDEPGAVHTDESCDSDEPGCPRRAERAEGQLSEEKGDEPAPRADYRTAAEVAIDVLVRNAPPAPPASSPGAVDHEPGRPYAGAAHGAPWRLVLACATSGSSNNYKAEQPFFGENMADLPRWTVPPNTVAGDRFAFFKQELLSNQDDPGRGLMELFVVLAVLELDGNIRTWWADQAGSIARFRRQGKLVGVLSPKIGELPLRTFKAAGGSFNERSTRLVAWPPALTAHIVFTPRLWQKCATEKPSLAGVLRRKNSAEQVCRETLEWLTGLQWPSVRPDFLLRPQTNRRLELDCYCEDFGTACEYNGSYHYVHVPPYNGRPGQSLENIAARDAFKAARCLDVNIELFVVNYQECVLSTPRRVWVSVLREKLSRTVAFGPGTDLAVV